MRLEEFKKWLIIYCVKPQTATNYYEAIKRFSLKYEEVTQENVDSYLSNLIEQNKSYSTSNQFICGMVKYNQFANLQIKLPNTKRQKQKIKPYLKEADLAEIIKKVKYIVRKPDKYIALIQFLFYAGLRRREVVNLKREDVDLENCIVTVHETKTDTARQVTFPKHVGKLLNIYFLREREIKNAFNVSYQTIYDSLQRIGKQMSIPDKLHPHALRHACGHYLLALTGDYKVVQRMLGHIDINTTMIYTDISNEEAVQTLKKIYSKQ